MKWTREFIIERILHRYNNNLGLNSTIIDKEEPGLRSMAKKRFGSWKNAIVEAGLNYDEISKQKTWSKEEIVEKIKQRVDNNLSIDAYIVQLDDNKLYSAARRKFQTWGNAIIASGLNYGEGTHENRIKWNKELIIKKIKELAEKGIELNATNISKIDSKLYVAASNHFNNGWNEALDASGFNYKKIKIKSDGLEQEECIQMLHDYKMNGYPLNYAYIKENNVTLINACEKHFGTYERAIEHCGWNYDEIREDNELMQYYGNKFEKLLGKMFKEINKDFIKGYSNEIIPDFVFKDNPKHWSDAKLSEWTMYGSKTIEKYEPFCDSLTIVFLRGDKTRNEHITNKTKIISVYELISTLPESIKNKYIEKYDALWEQVNEKEEKIRKEPIIGLKSEYIGVYWNKNGQKWTSHFELNGKNIYIGIFDSDVDAAKAYDEYILNNKLNRPINFGLNELLIYRGNSRFKGVSYKKHAKKYRAAITVNKKQIYLGYFESEIEAAKAYNNYIIQNNLNRVINQIS